MTKAALALNDTIIGTWKINKMHSKGVVDIGESQDVDVTIEDLQDANCVIIAKDRAFKQILSDERTNRELPINVELREGDNKWEIAGSELIVSFGNPEYKDRKLTMQITMTDNDSAVFVSQTRESVDMGFMKMKFDLVDSLYCTRER
jgi:hypothetical protein